MKRIVLLVLCAILFLTGCSKKKDTGYLPDGTPKPYNEENMPQGVLIRTPEDKYYRLFQPVGDGGDYIWTVKRDQSVPVLTPNMRLILHTTKEIPAQLTFTKLVDFGYTVGIRFQRLRDGTGLTFPSSDYAPGSPVGNIVHNKIDGGTPNSVVIKEINGKEFTEHLLSVQGFLKGLTKDAMYKIYFYTGTVYRDVNVKADTHVYLRDYQLPSGSYNELKDKVFEINLPTGLEAGYWMVEGYGMFKYETESTLILE